MKSAGQSPSTAQYLYCPSTAQDCPVLPSTGMSQEWHFWVKVAFVCGSLDSTSKRITRAFARYARTTLVSLSCHTKRGRSWQHTLAPDLRATCRIASPRV